MPLAAGAAAAAGQREEAATKVLSAWRAADHSCAFLAADHELVDATGPLRALVVALLLRDPGESGRDLFHACGALGRALAEGGGSPTFAGGTLDRLVTALDKVEGGTGADAWSSATGMRAALFESFVHTLAGAHRDRAHHEWDYPACVVGLERGVFAVAAGHPSDDVEALNAWASRVAHALAIAGARSAVVTGSPEAVAALSEALDIAGIEQLEGWAPPASPSRPARR